MSGADNLHVHVAWFPNGGEKGKPALGIPETLPWSTMVSIIAGNRRIGDKDGPNFIPTRFKLEEDGRQVRRLGRNAVARTMVALDCEKDKRTGEVPPEPAEVVARLHRLGVAAIVYTSHSHLPVMNPR